MFCGSFIFLVVPILLILDVLFAFHFGVRFVAAFSSCSWGSSFVLFCGSFVAFFFFGVFSPCLWFLLWGSFVLSVCALGDRILLLLFLCVVGFLWLSFWGMFARGISSCLWLGIVQVWCWGLGSAFRFLLWAELRVEVLSHFFVFGFLAVGIWRGVCTLSIWLFLFGWWLNCDCGIC